MAIAVDGEVLVQIKARSLAIGKELDGRAVSFLGGSKRFIKGRVLGPVKLCDRRPFLAPAEALAATGAEEGAVAADSAEEATGVPDSFADAASTWGLATVLTEDASTADSETEAKPSSAKA
ncbi:MAG: hypothetical protein UDK32_10750 [Adlercreutzia sp.]|nr:hypothetical protein [Adlercreutzia sp.]